MIIAIHLRHFKCYKGINFIPLSNGENFGSLIGENGTGKSSVLEALDFILNKKNTKDWPINNEAKSESSVVGDNAPFIVATFLIPKSSLRKTKAEDLVQYNKAVELSNYLWETNFKTKAKGFDEFYEHRNTIKEKFSKEDNLFLMIGKRQDIPGIFFGSFQNDLTFIQEKKYQKYEDPELQTYFDGFFDYICSHYSYLYIPVETDAHTYTKLETSDMQKLMDKNIHTEIENAISKQTLKQINNELDKFIKDIEKTLESYEYKGVSKNSLTMPDLISKIIEAYFSIKVLNKKDKHSKRVPVYNMSSGEKRKALIDVAYSFLVRNKERDRQIILAVDEPDASLHMSACYRQFSRLYELSDLGHQILITTHWYGFLPIISKGSATSIKKVEENEVKTGFFDLYNYREQLSQEKKRTRGPLPYDISLKSYNDLVQSIIYSLMEEPIHNWIICEGLSEKIYFEQMFRDNITKNNLKILPVGGFKEVKKVYDNLASPMGDSDYDIKGTVYCLIDTDAETMKADPKTVKGLMFKRLLNDKSETILVDINSAKATPPTEIEDCLNPKIFFKTLAFFKDSDNDIKELLDNYKFVEDAKISADALDLRKSDSIKLKAFFDKNLGGNKLKFASKYVEICQDSEFANEIELGWVTQIKADIISTTRKHHKEEIKKQVKADLKENASALTAVDNQGTGKAVIKKPIKSQTELITGKIIELLPIQNDEDSDSDE
jgi:predicted ATP-dependent endonuclease of OLD family